MIEIKILLSGAGLQPPVDWTSSDAVARIRDVNSMQDIFEVGVNIQGHHFSSYAHSLRSLMMDLMINHRILLSGKRFNFFISETPLFTAQASGQKVAISFYNQSGNHLQLEDKLSAIDCFLQLLICNGLVLLCRIAPDSLPSLLDDVHQDIASDNRADFIGP